MASNKSKEKVKEGKEPKERKEGKENKVKTEKKETPSRGSLKSALFYQAKKEKATPLTVGAMNIMEDFVYDQLLRLLKEIVQLKQVRVNQIETVTPHDVVAAIKLTQTKDWKTQDRVAAYVQHRVDENETEHLSKRLSKTHI